MSFGIEEKKVTLPYVQSDNVKFGVVTAFPKFKYHVKYPQGVVVNNEDEEVAIGNDWVDSPAEFGVETSPSVDPTDEVQVRLAEIRAAVAKTKE